jgi:biotin carboxyl carrier protein
MSVHEVVSEIAGTVWEVRVNPGDKVEDAGVVEAVLVEKGSSVAEGQVVASVRT